RVCEEVVRFILNSPSLTLEFKKIRHGLDNTIEKLFPSKTNLILKRQANKDVGKVISEFEFRRKNILDVFCANIQRVKESIRVLEEFSKLKERKIALDFKKIRYLIYELEKKVITKIKAVYNS
ncbi:MAG: hypothetical protein NC936_01025, partial [Candidatus Omnitrophica bacterium]|nr:hypothetical protein [Candidatus Omnitrophota bacterium]